MGRNWLCRMGVRIFVLLACSVMGGLWDGTAHAQEFYLSLDGNPSVSSSYGTPVPDGGFNTGRVQTVGPLTRSDNQSISGAAGSSSSSASYNYNIQAELGHLKGSFVAMGRATGGTAIRGRASGGLDLWMNDTLTSNGIGDFQITLTLRSRVIQTPAGSTCPGTSVRAVLAAPTPLQVNRTCSSDTAVSVQTATASIHSSSPGERFALQVLLQLNANAGAVGTISPSVDALVETDALDDPPDMTVKVDPLTPGLTYTTASGTSYLSSVPNVSPVANAGSNQTVPIRQPVSLDGSASTDPDNNTPLTYAWSFVSRPAGSAATLSNANTSLPSFTPDAVGNFIVQLVVTDSLGAASAPAAVTVSTVNSAPIADGGPDQAITLIGTTVQLDGRTSYDPDGDAITYMWTLTQKPANSMATLSNSSSSMPTFVADKNGDYFATLVVTDSRGEASASDSITISFSNVKPVADAGGNQAVTLGQTVLLNGVGSSDANGDALAYSWNMVSAPAGSTAALVGATTQTPSFTTDAAGTFVISLIVHDGFLNSDPSTVTIEVTTRQSQAITVVRQAITAINALGDSSFKNPNMRNALTNKLNAVLRDIDQGLYQEALNKLQNDILAKTGGCSTIGSPDKNDWIRDCASQSLVVPALRQAIALLHDLI